MRSQSSGVRAEAALYWSAVSLIVCEGLPIDKAAERLGVEDEELREILSERFTVRGSRIERVGRSQTKS